MSGPSVIRLSKSHVMYPITCKSNSVIFRICICMHASSALQLKHRLFDAIRIDDGYFSPVAYRRKSRGPAPWLGRDMTSFVVTVPVDDDDAGAHVDYDGVGSAQSGNALVDLQTGCEELYSSITPIRTSFGAHLTGKRAGRQTGRLTHRIPSRIRGPFRPIDSLVGCLLAFLLACLPG